MLVSDWQRRSAIINLGLTVLAALLVLLPAPFALRLAGASLLLFFVSGYALLQATGLWARDWLEQAVFAFGLSLSLTVLVSLGIVYVSGGLPAAALIAVLAGLSLVLSLFNLLRSGNQPGPGPAAGGDILFFAIAVLFSSLFGLVYSGYADYWGDEMNGLLRAIAIISGRQVTIFEHTKGPVEVLIPAGFGLLVGRFEPFTLRFPFGIMFGATIGACFLLARSLFNRKVGLVAALLVALNGLYLSYARIVQYQMVILLLTCLSLLAAYRFYRQGKWRFLGLSLVLVGVGTLAHYDTFLVLAPIAYLVWRQAGGQLKKLLAGWQPLLLCTALLLAIVAAFYLPFLANPHIGTTSSYLSRVIFSPPWPANNFDEIYEYSSQYNSSYLLAFIFLLGLGAILADLLRLIRERRGQPWLIGLLAATLVVFAAAALLGQARFVPLLLSLLVFGLLIFFSAMNTERRLLYVWLAVPFIAYVFLVDHPRNHLQILYPSWSILAALGVQGAAQWLGSKIPAFKTRWAAAAGGLLLALLFGFFAAYDFLLYVDTQTEYMFNYPQYKSRLFWEDPNFPFNARRPYAAPHRLGWQTINQLYLEGELAGDWDSNDHSSNIFWYTLGHPRNLCYPRYYFRTEFEQKEGGGEPPRFDLDRYYTQIGQVWNRDELKIDVFEYAPLDGGPDEPVLWPEPQRYTSFLTASHFTAVPYQDQEPVAEITLDPPAQFRPSQQALQAMAEHYQDPRIPGIHDQVALVGYDLDTSQAQPGGALMVTLYWQAVQPMHLPLKISIHLEGFPDESGQPQLRLQSDDFPHCGANPAPEWKVGETIPDRHLIELPPELPPGENSLRIGLYEPGSNQRLDWLDVAGNPAGTSYELTRLPLPK